MAVIDQSIRIIMAPLIIIVDGFQASATAIEAKAATIEAGAMVFEAKAATIWAKAVSSCMTVSTAIVSTVICKAKAKAQDIQIGAVIAK